MSQMQQPRFVCEVIEDFEHYAVTCFREFGDKITSEPQVFDWWVEMGKRYLLSWAHRFWGHRNHLWIVLVLFFRTFRLHYV